MSLLVDGVGEKYTVAVRKCLRGDFMEWEPLLLQVLRDMPFNVLVWVVEWWNGLRTQVWGVEICSP